MQPEQQLAVLQTAQLLLLTLLSPLYLAKLLVLLLVLGASSYQVAGCLLWLLWLHLPRDQQQLPQRCLLLLLLLLVNPC